MAEVKTLKKVAYVFPGQGSQYVGMGKELAENFESAAKIFDEANTALEFDLKKLCFEGPVDDLKKTEITQPAILTVSVAIFAILKKRGLLPSVAAGHSLGEYSALTAAGTIDFMDAVRLVNKRGKFMQSAVPEGHGAMVAILGLPYDKVLELASYATSGIVCAANFNSPGQVVISGEKKPVEEVASHCKEAGAKRVIPLAVSAPFHCALMQPAAERLKGEFTQVKFQDARFPVVSNVTGEYMTAAAEIKQKLVEQVVSTVLWQQSVENMISKGIDTFVELGPKKVLSGLIKKINPQVKILNIEDLASFKTTIDALS
ncbi:MAG: ACP S-malonyltransferase [Candidatus Margulisbacteria bacterium]|nr:ACP S-malonyltransferase [Candidatus Margulisiibacteriota bacterium]MBU1021877.1 ACP S-malonyltransferase [Candidatus Margulisiibacteriota bacterium]MBU1728515.1 ACP S-malonyltransferase [Candidatus Margulisiibacteriota bacterium]MBU1954662.1 ACP S-malonyltransferase [Candidatus Margulisiibacteriota bacterium]